MGCDIHGIVEFKKTYSHRWDGLMDLRPLLGRNYALFSILANVRNDRKKRLDHFPITDLPDDLSDETKEQMDYWKDDGHSYNCLHIDDLGMIKGHEYYFQELKDVQEGDMIIPVWEYIQYEWKLLMSFLRTLKEKGDGIEDIRIIFWFDN